MRCASSRWEGVSIRWTTAGLCAVAGATKWRICRRCIPRVTPQSTTLNRRVRVSTRLRGPSIHEDQVLPSHLSLAQLEDVKGAVESPGSPTPHERGWEGCEGVRMGPILTPSLGGRADAN